MLSRTLFVLSLAYLALPILIFCAGWLTPVWAVVAIAALAAALFGASRWVGRAARGEAPGEEAAQVTPLVLVVYALVCGLWLYLAGVGGYGFQDSDWIKHEALLKDLIREPWPVLYQVYGVSTALVYYLAYYLPAALIGKWGGWDAANLALFGWTWLGLMLAVLWFGLLIRSLSLRALLLFVIFAGLDAIGYLLTGPPEWLQLRHLEGWSTLNLQYSAVASSLFWAPQHALPGWIGAGLMLYLLEGRGVGLTLLPPALTALWSPFVALGLLPFTVAGFFSAEGGWRTRIRQAGALPNVGALVMCGVIGLFYAAKLLPLAPFLVSETPQGLILAGAPGGWLAGFDALAVFALLEFGLYAALALAILRTTPDWARPERVIFWTMVATLCALMIYRYGINNDLAMRASIPALFVLAVLVGRALLAEQGSRRLRWALGVVLVIGALTPFYEFARHIVPFWQPDAPWTAKATEKREGIVELFLDDSERLAQYTGSIQAPFFRYLAKPIPTPSADAPMQYVNFGDKILYAGYRLDPEQKILPGSIPPGTEVALRLDLDVFTRVIDQNYSLALQLIGEDGREVWKLQSWPQDRPTSQVSDDVHWDDTRMVALPAQPAEGLYRLELSVVAPESGEKLAASALPGGRPLGEIVPIGYIEVGGSETATTTQHSQATLGDQIAVVDTTVAPASMRPGETVTATVRWQTLTPPAQDYTGFVHLLDAEGRLVAQRDQPPRNGFLPTHLWRPGFALDDAYALTVPAELPAGSYRLVGGMYDLASGARLPVTVEGAPAGDTFEVGVIQVE